MVPLSDWTRSCERAGKERDEALAEVERLRADLTQASNDHASVAACLAAAGHETAWLKSLLAEERARADRAEERARLAEARDRLPVFRRVRLEADAELAAIRLQEILRLRREREEIRIDRSAVNELHEAMKPSPTPREPEPADCSGGDVALYGVGYTCGKCGARGRLVEGTDGRKRIAHHRTGGDTRKAEKQRPPLGVIPDYIWRERRCQELADAIARRDFNREPDLVGAWAEELYDHIAWIQEHRQ